MWTSGIESVKRHSADGRKVGDWQVLTDTPPGIGRVFADALRCRLTYFTEEWGLYPLVPRASVAVSDSARHGDCLGTSGDENLWARELAVSARSQSV